MQNEYVLEMKHITKRYGSNTVLSDVSLSVKKGEIHALLGENGAGKSTLMNTLFGMPVIHSTGGFEGEVFLNGEKVNIGSPQDAMNMGIGMVHQEFMLLPGFTIAENIKLNREITHSNLAKAGKYNGYLLEGMACPGGCIAGAGTLLSLDQAAKAVELAKKAATKKNPLESEFSGLAEELV